MIIFGIWFIESHNPAKNRFKLETGSKPGLLLRAECRSKSHLFDKIRHSSRAVVALFALTKTLVTNYNEPCLRKKTIVIPFHVVFFEQSLFFCQRLWKFLKV